MIFIKKNKDSAEYYNLHNKIKLNMDIKDGNMFAKSEKQRTFGNKEQRTVVLLGIILFVLLIVSILTVVNVTDNNFSLAWILKHMMRRVSNIFDLISGNHLESGIQFFICQFAAPVLAGAALAAAGACFQGVFHNPMASPTLLGVQSGGALGATVYVLFFSSLSTMVESGVGYRTYGDYVEAYYSQNIFQHNVEQFFVLIGCLLVVTVVVAIAKRSNHGRLNTVSLMLGGTVFTGMITTLLSMVQYYLTVTNGSEDMISSIRSITTGRFTTVTIPEVLLCMAVPIVISLVLIIILSDKLNVIVFGEEEAKTMGINVDR